MYKHIYVCLSIYLSIYLFIYLSIYLYRDPAQAGLRLGSVGGSALRRACCSSHSTPAPRLPPWSVGAARAPGSAAHPVPASPALPALPASPVPALPAARAPPAPLAASLAPVCPAPALPALHPAPPAIPAPAIRARSTVSRPRAVHPPRLYRPPRAVPPRRYPAVVPRAPCRGQK